MRIKVKWDLRTDREGVNGEREEDFYFYFFFSLFLFKIYRSRIVGFHQSRRQS